MPRARRADAPREAHDETAPLRPFEAQACDAIGAFIDFWGFKANHGRLWTLLYLRRRPLPSSELQAALGLSKAAVSLLTRDLENWGVVIRHAAPASRKGGEAALTYEAETDLRRMIGRVLGQREAGLLRRIREGLEEAVSLAEAEPDPDPDTLARLERLAHLARLVESALALFTKTARLDVTQALSLLSTTDRPARRRRGRR